MPMDKSRYPKNWKEIAEEIKRSADWHCQECGKDCRLAFLELDRSVRAKLTLTVHHQDYNPANNEPENLIALCSGCHLKRHAGRRGNISPGQLTLKLQEEI